MTLLFFQSVVTYNISIKGQAYHQFLTIHTGFQLMYFFTGPKKKPPTVSDRPSSLSPTPEAKYEHDNQVLSLQVEALQAQLQEQTKLSKEQVHALMEDRRVKEEEFETRCQRDEDKIKTLSEK